MASFAKTSITGSTFSPFRFRRCASPWKICRYWRRRCCEQLNRKHGTKVTDISAAVLERFRAHSWPGNVRELRNVLERAVILTGEGTAGTDALPANFSTPTVVVKVADGDQSQVHMRIGTTIGEAEKVLIQRTLVHTRNNKTRAAEILGISLKTLHNKLKEYGAAEND